MANNGYWQRVVQSRISRRRALAGAAAGGVGLAALSLIGCGGSDSGSDGPIADKSGLIHVPRETQGRAGGVLKHYVTADILHFDATADPSGSTVAGSSEPFYPRMLALKSVKFPNEADGSSVGEAAESWEMSPDRLQITFKLRQGMKWDARAPTSGRPLDAQDVMFTWDKYRRVNSTASFLAYNANTAPDAPVESLSAPDARTIVAKLHAPSSSVLPLFSARDSMYISPREADGGFNPRTTVRGHGPYILEDYVPSARFLWARNPDFYIKDRPYFDKVEVPIVSDQAQRLAQFRAGNIYTDVLTGNQENIVLTKRELPDTLLVQDGNFPVSSTNMITFGWEQGEPFKDSRLRQALSMMLDREAFIDVMDNRENFRKDGLELPVKLNSVVPAGWGDFYLDPTNEREFGPSAKYLKLDLAEAKKLMTAAGYANGFEFDLNFAGGGQYGASYNRIAELYNGMFIAGGLRPKMTPINPADRWLNDFSRGYRTAPYLAGEKPGFRGISIVPERVYPTVAVQLYNQFHRDGGAFRGIAVDGGKVTDGDPKLNDLAAKISQETDRNRQKDLVHELIRVATAGSYYIPKISSAKAFSLWWPVIGNLGSLVSYPGASNWTDLRQNWFIDDTKPPLKRA